MALQTALTQERARAGVDAARQELAAPRSPRWRDVLHYASAGDQRARSPARHCCPGRPACRRQARTSAPGLVAEPALPCALLRVACNGNAANAEFQVECDDGWVQTIVDAYRGIVRLGATSSYEMSSGDSCFFVPGACSAALQRATAAVDFSYYFCV